MDKRGAKILISCILCTVIVSVLFLIAFRISRLTCELVRVEPQRLRLAQLDWFEKKGNKPVRSGDKTILVKLSGYLEYNILSTDGDDEPDARTSTTTTTTSTTTSRPLGFLARDSQRQGQAQGANDAWPSFNENSNQGAAQGQLHAQLQANLNQQQQLANSSLGHNSQQQQQLGALNSTASKRRVAKRFLPLELDSIETRHLANGGDSSLNKHKYILDFNCTKLSMVFVYQSSRVYVESMSLELKPSSNHKSHCELELPKTGAFAVDSAAAAVGTTPTLPGQPNQSASGKGSDSFARYYCNKPLSYACRHYSRNGPSSSNGLLLAELHISAIEFETATPTAGGKGDRKHVKREFKSKRNECNVLPLGATN